MNKKDKPRATHESNLPVGNITLRVAVLSDGSRVITRNGMFQAFKRTQRGRSLKETTRVVGFPSFIDAQNLQPFISDELRKELTEFEYVSKSGKMVRRGYKAEILPLVSDVYLQARQAGALSPQQAPLALQAEILTRSLAKVGIVALIDEATGYQSERDKDELQKILGAYISAELLPYQRRFPLEYYKQIYRLRGWPWPPKKKNHTQFVGVITNKIVYELLPEGVLEELQSKNPVLEDKGYRAHKHFQYLTLDIGNPNLEKHLAQIIVLMRISKDWQEFEDHLTEAFERYGKQTKLHLNAEVKPKKSPANKLREFLDSGGRDDAESDFNRALRKASNP
jgi:hypothetical protein